MNLYKRTFLYGIGIYGSKVLDLLLVPLYTVYLLPAQYGYYNIYVAAAAILTPIVSVGLSDAVYRFGIQKEKGHSSSEILSTVFISILVNYILFCLIMLPFIYYYSPEYSYIFLIYILVILLNGFFTQMARAQEKIFLFSIISCAAVVITCLLNICFLVFLNMKAEALLLSTIISSAVSSLILSIWLKFWKNFSFVSYSFSLFKVMVKYSFPLILAASSWWVMMFADRFFLSYFCGMEEVGVYSIACKFSGILIMLYMGFQNTWQDFAIKFYKDETAGDDFTRIFNHIMTLAFTVGIFVIACSKFILNHFIDSQYYIAWKFIPILILAAVFQIFAYFYSIGFHCNKNTKWSFYTSLSGAAANTVLNIILIPKFGIQGAVIATCTAFFTMWLFRLFLVQGVLKIKINWKRLVLLLVLLGIEIFVYLKNTLLLYETLIFIFALIIFICFNVDLLKTHIIKILGVRKSKCFL